MIRVKNRQVIARLSARSLRANRSRNLIAIAAIALTTLLFTALMTIALSMNAAFQQSNFRTAGGWNHGSFKRLTEEQFDALKGDPGIKEWGLRRMLGMPKDAPFDKDHVEISYCDANAAHWMFCDPTVGRLPQEGTDEAVADLHVLELLGIEPELGKSFTISFISDRKPVTLSFTLCGWWEHDEASLASHVLIPQSRVEQVLAQLDIDPSKSFDSTGVWELNVMLPNSLNIGGDMEAILARHGYQDQSRNSEGYIGTGVNWGYTGAQLSSAMDPTTVVIVITAMVVIILTGYLIIYNVFQISVANDIRFYGLLKTVGTTPRQLRRIVRRQALMLALPGLPLGFALGWLAGYLLAPVVAERMSGLSGVISASPLIFLLSGAFSLITVLLSCLRPSLMAARVSPVEALRYTEGGSRRKAKRSGAVSLPRMALENLGRNPGKTAVTILSLSLAVLLLTMTVTFTNGFDMDKYLASKVASDYVLATSDYFQDRGGGPVSEDSIAAVNAQGGIACGGRVYGSALADETVTEEYFRHFWSHWDSNDLVDWRVDHAERAEDGRLVASVSLYGMEAFALDRLTLIEGDLSELYQPGSRAIAAVYRDDDYGEVIADSHYARLGDKISLRYIDEYEYVDPETGEPVAPDSDEPCEFHILRSHYETYTVAALVVVPSALSYRYYGSDQFVLNDETFTQDSGTDRILLYAFDMADDDSDAAMDGFLQSYTTGEGSELDYESKSDSVKEFEGFRSMFLLMGGALSLIVGLVGVLNFLNTVLTGILTRRREFAMLQSIGMTGKQLKLMLVWEGLIYAVGALLFSLVLTLTVGPLLARLLETVFWFYSYNLSLLPILVLLPVFLLLGSALPIIAYRRMSRSTIVERLRETE